MRSGAFARQSLVSDDELAAVADGAAHGREVAAVAVLRAGAARRNCDTRCFRNAAQTRRQHGGDLRDGGVRRAGKGGIAPGADHARAEDERLDLILREHEGRQLVARSEHIAETRLALDGHAARLQVGHVAVDGADGHFQFAGQFLRGHDPLRAPEIFDDVEETVGAAHEALPVRGDRPRTLLTVRCQ